jgi:SAM-dependent methyltransferase
MDKESVKKLIVLKYGEIADNGNTSCCSSGCCSGMSDDYSSLEGYNPDADMGLGCGLPTQYSGIKEGDCVVDLGAGAGNDCFVARGLAGESGRIIGIDTTPSMVEKAKVNAGKLGYANVEFIHGDIEDIPLPGATADVVISNCVLNLLPRKDKIFNEIFRVLKPGGHFSISDVVTVGKLPQEIRESPELYAGCIAGAIEKNDYLGYIKQAGFIEVEVQKEKEISLSQDLANKYQANNDFIVLSVTVNGNKL